MCVNERAEYSSEKDPVQMRHPKAFTGPHLGGMSREKKKELKELKYSA